MQFNELDKKMRQFETASDRRVLPDVYMAIRIDGRGFTNLTKKVCHFEAPFDVRFRDMMVNTVKHLMQCGFHIRYGYTQSDEISLLIDKNDAIFDRKVRKIISVLAGEASAAFSLELGRVAAFDCRVCELPSKDLVVDYFRWRQADAQRNALNSWCYWTLRNEGINKTQAYQMLAGKSVAQKRALLAERGIDYDKLPSWQKNGTGLWHATVQHEGYNPVTRQFLVTTRNRITTNYDLPDGAGYEQLIKQFLE